MANSLTLMICKAEKRFAVRQTRRVQLASNTLSHPMYIYTSTPNCPRLTLGGFQDDGPLSPCYKTVINFEMRQVQEDVSTLRQRAEFLEENYVKAQRIHVFFYGTYAEALSTIFLQKQTQHLYFSLQNVPHTCVFPYPASNWHEAHDMSECCLCIGDRDSKMKLTDDQGNEVMSFGFDHPDMEIYVATGSRLEFIEHVSCLTPCQEHGVNVEPVRIEDSPFCDLAEQRPLKLVSQSDSTYIKLSDLDAEYESYQSIHAGDRSEKCLCDVMAVVLSFTPARQLKESDWMMTVSLIDESIAPSNVDDEPQSISINIFGIGKHHFPHVRLAGDVIRMHRLEVKKFKGNVQLTGLKQSSFLVCRKEEQSEGVWEWTYVASQNTETTESEKKEMERLWLWGQERQRNFPSLRSQYQCTLSNLHVPQESLTLSSGFKGDFSVMITGVYPMPAGDLIGNVPRGFLRVWDGTGIPISDPNPVDEQNENGDPSPEVLTRLAAACRKSGLDPPTQITGRVVNVAIWEDPHWEQIKDLQPGTFLRLRNAWDDNILYKQLTCLTVAYSRGVTHVTPIPDDCFEVIDLLKKHDARRGEERNAESGILPLEQLEIENGDVPISAPMSLFQTKSLQELLTSYDDGVFTGRVFLKNLIPSLSSISSIDKILTKADDDSYYYRLGLCIETENGDAADVVVLEPAAEILVAMNAQSAKQRSAQAFANLKSRLEDRVGWDCSVRSIMFEGTRILLLESMTEKSFLI
ncbi:hypothetical protein FisN_5Lh030 [Fistulifera solaris]|uniref:Telomeric single stranded DNA binding POT1/Cdc13 domain-containing protein n=1 Tax=Fistulifera solaris TaxID=1519565 RepID=A0A1Z5JJE2_FISSO|nr:hypothetical protein FisN_5Lh030 [Fistulifera solaris]|eukprot:GAX14046.1 hypothetical protein FisN_5Lh030 [Fistulifera solaris]